MFEIKQACREASPLLIGLPGESGSGKTMTAIKLARGIVGPDEKIGFLDTERGRANMYSDAAGGFDIGELNAPFSPERYVEAIRAFEQAGYRILIIDSASHEWEGEGGVLDKAEKTGTSGLKKWQAPKLAHKRFMRALTTSRMHIIVCLRTKTKLRQVGKEIVSDGLVPIQEKGFIYEMTISAMLDNTPGQEGVPTLTKCPDFLRGAFDGGKVTEETGRKIIAAMGQKQIDDELEDLRQAGNDKAFEGTDALRDWFSGLTAEQKRKIKPSMENLKSIAAEADSAAAGPAASDDVPDNPFSAGDAA